MKGHSTGYLATTTTDKQGHKKKNKIQKDVTNQRKPGSDDI